MANNVIENFFDFWAVSEKLKTVKRWKGVPQMKEKETASDHSWQLAALAFISAKKLSIEVDLLKSLKLALVHDIVEAITDDVDSVLIHSGEADRATKEIKEREAIKQIANIFPQSSGNELVQLWNEYDQKNTREAKFIYALDKLESVTHLIFCGHRSFHEHDDFIATYCHTPVENFPELKPLHSIIQQKLKAEYQKHDWKWYERYDVDIDPGDLNDKADKIIDFTTVCEQLKRIRRYGTVREMPEKESTADHSWNLAIASFIVITELGLTLDPLKSIELALFHDLPEAVTGDIDYSLIYFGHKTKEDKHKSELAAINKIARILGAPAGNEIMRIWEEYEESITEESKFIKALDKIEGINHVLCLGHKCFDHPELIAPYPNKATLQYPPLIPLLEELHRRLKPEFKKLGWRWKKEYSL